MSLIYRTYDFRMKIIDRPLVFDKFPGFILHSVLGMHFRKLACFTGLDECQKCGARFACPYGQIFVTFLKKNNEVLEGRNRGSHPFVFYVEAPLDTAVHAFNIRMVLIGESVAYFPYFYFAIQDAGKAGLGNSRDQVRISEVRCDDVLLEHAEQNIMVPPGHDIFDFEKQEPFKGALRLWTRSPLRLKINGKIVKQLKLPDLFRVLYRRARILCGMYGESGPPAIDPDQVAERLEVEEINNVWQEYRYFSGAQKRKMKLGGIVCSLRIKGSFPAEAIALLEFGEKFQIGKNQSFGFGKYSLERE